MISDFYSLAIGEPIAISALHGSGGVGDLLEEITSDFEYDVEEDEEFYRDVENNISDYVLFFAKVRKGEVWNKEMGKAAVNKAVESLKNLSYKQV